MANLTTTYTRLRTDVRKILTDGRLRATRAVEGERVTTYWAIGKAIHEHLLENQDRAAYGDQVMLRLAEDVGIARQRLYEILRFHRQVPSLRTSGKLGFSHYVEVLSLETSEERDFYLDEAERNGWSVRDLKAQIREDAYHLRLEARDGGQHGPTPIRGRLYTYSVYDVEGSSAVIDLGFNHERRLPLSSVEGGVVEPGTLAESVRGTRSGSAYGLVRSDTDPRLRYTYRARVLRVVDGDTIRVGADLGFDSGVRHTIRLRGIDAPEMRSSRGKKAKAFVERALGDVDFVVLRTYWRGRYGRYLADLFYDAGQPDAHLVAARGTYLNGELVQEGLASAVQ